MWQQEMAKDKKYMKETILYCTPSEIENSVKIVRSSLFHDPKHTTTNKISLYTYDIY